MHFKINNISLIKIIIFYTFIVNQNSPCGSTIGPKLSANTGVKTIDIGAPQLAMHSCREICGTTDALYYHKLFVSFFQNFRDASSTLLDH